MIYYGQALEDKFMNDNYFKNKKNGKYIELGAIDGILYSNTKYFEDNHKWSGILIEPNKTQYSKLKVNRPNNKLFNNLVSNIKKEVVYKFFVDNYSGVSGIKSTLPSEHLNTFFRSNSDISRKNSNSEEKIIPIPLTEIIKQCNFKHYDLLSLDVEGHELEVLLSWDFSIPIDIILIEALGGSQIEKSKQCHELLIKNGYVFDRDYKHNKIYKLKSYSNPTPHPSYNPNHIPTSNIINTVIQNNSMVEVKQNPNNFVQQKKTKRNQQTRNNIFNFNIFK